MTYPRLFSAATVGAAAITAGVVLSGCTTASDATAVAVEETTTTPTTRAPRLTDESGRPDITFDPCLDIPDDVLVEAGYDPRTEDSADYPMEHYTFIGCNYRAPVAIPGVIRSYGLGILAGNVTLDEELAKDAAIASETTVNGRRALLEYNPTPDNTCAIAVQTDFGIVIFSRSYHADHTRTLTYDERCGGLTDAVALFEPFIENNPGKRPQ
ncbi:uncharacterized protein DUF3558 [Rhodococcus sp. SMB37]|uniref:DUF3558 domain-containing protein n=1 Tax=Rhodococcus sp. SMB37 TaxID=2512213 RepID=UPI000B1531CF|nr:DUF3558 domain-containing protein [Rhodococcus sp. SMB37]TCN49798.1 uncharacterized protein DUF3558 [Rhodococcus sp. SMB37]